MIKLRPITIKDIEYIKTWPPYGGGFECMDYALRQNGWLDEFIDKADTRIYLAESDNRAVGFSLLCTRSEGEAEFRIAIHPHETGKGLGRKIAIMTLEAGFQTPGMDRIRLIVRKKNAPAIKLYEKLGFNRVGESVHDIQGKTIEFFDMVIDRDTFSHLHAG